MTSESKSKARAIKYTLLKGFLLSAGVLALNACSVFSEEEEFEPTSLPDYEEELTVETLWDYSVGNGLGEIGVKLEPAVDGDVIFAADTYGLVVALDRHTGDELWEVELVDIVKDEDGDEDETPVQLSGGVGAGAGLVLIGSFDGELIALSQVDGSEQWRVQLSSEILSVPQTDGDVIVTQTQDGKLYGHELDGTRRWVYDGTIPVLTLRGTSSPVLVKGLALSGLASGKLVAIRLSNGIPIWEQRVAVAQGKSELDRIIDVDSQPLVDGGMVFSTSYQGRVMAVAIDSGRVRWQEDISSYQSMAAGFGNLYTVNAEDEIIALDKRKSDEKWKQSALTYRRLTSPSILDNYLVIADYDGYVHFLSQVDGRFVARERADRDGVRTKPLVTGNTVYVMGNSGELTAYQVTEE